MKLLILSLLLNTMVFSADFDESQGQELIAEFKLALNPLYRSVTTHGLDLEVVLLWEEESLQLGGAYTLPIQVGNVRTSQIAIEGGMIRHSLMTIQALPLVLCHELGHIIAAKYPYNNSKIPKYNVEMVIDHFASNICIPKLLKSSYFQQLLFNSDGVDAAFSLALYLHHIFATQGQSNRNAHGLPHPQRQTHKFDQDYAQCTFLSYRNGFYSQPLPSCALNQ